MWTQGLATFDDGSTALPPETTLPNFQRLLGPDAWHRLSAATQARFAQHAGTTTYRGHMECVRASFCGRLIAQLLRLAGTPLVPYEGTNVVVTVHVRPDFARRGVVWERIYEFPGRAPLTVQSTKTIGARGLLVESLSAGLRMELFVEERTGDLVFESTCYYLELGPLRITLPKWLPPGATQVRHHDHGDGSFRFTFQTSHPWFGQMFFQSGVFH